MAATIAAPTLAKCLFLSNIGLASLTQCTGKSETQLLSDPTFMLYEDLQDRKDLNQINHSNFNELDNLDMDFDANYMQNMGLPTGYCGRHRMFHNSPDYYGKVTTDNSNNVYNLQNMEQNNLPVPELPSMPYNGFWGDTFGNIGNQYSKFNNDDKAAKAINGIFNSLEENHLTPFELKASADALVDEIWESSKNNINHGEVKRGGKYFFNVF